MSERKRTYYKRCQEFTPTIYQSTHLAYMAGIIDGEGCFWIGEIPKKNGDGYTTAHYRGVLKIDNTDKRLLDWMDTVFSGTSSARCRSTSSRKFERTIFTWTATGDRLLDLCEQVIPYLVIKKEHCQNMINFRKTYTNKLGSNKLSDEQIEARRQCVLVSRNLNSRWHLHPLKQSS